MSQPVARPVGRPGSVTLLVVLMWINAILTFLVGLGIVLGWTQSEFRQGVASQLGSESGVTPVIGWVLVGAGVIIALCAIGLGRGSRVIRMIVTIVLVLRLLGDIILLLQGAWLPALVSIAVNVLLLWLLWNARANAFFARR